MSVLAVRERFCPSSLARGEPREDIPRPLLLPQPPAGTSRQGSTLVQPRGSIESTEQGKGVQSQTRGAEGNPQLNIPPASPPKTC